MGKKPSLLDVAGALYEAALQPEVWPEALSAVGSLVNGTTWTVFGVFGRDLGLRFQTQDAAGDVELLERLGNHYRQPGEKIFVPPGPALLSRGRSVSRREDFISDTEMLRDPLYREVLQPAHVFHLVTLAALTDPSHVMIAGTGRPRRCGAHTAQELQRMRQLLPHLQRATQILLRLGDLESCKTAHEALWDQLTCGVILLDRNGRVLWANRAAMAVVAAGDGLSVRRHALAAARPAEHAVLQALIRGAVAMSEGRGLSAGGAFSLSRPSLLRPLGLLVSPIHAWPDFARRPAVAVFVSDPERMPEPAPERLRRLYDLTKRQAALAALLMEGVDLADAAERLGISLHTARTHLRIIFDKTGTRRQSELVSLLLRGPAGLCEEA